MADLANNLDVTIAEFFTPEELDQLAKEKKFVQREGKLTGSLFLDLIVFNSEDLKSQSLNDLSAILKDEHGIEIRRQSLHERFNNYALSFLKNALEKLLQKQLNFGPDLLGNLEGFNRILIKDSTCFQIDKSLAAYYPGSGGKDSGAAVRIQFEYDILTGKINDISINAFNDQDAKNSIATVDLTQQGDLVLRDLAYMNLEVLKRIRDLLAFFVCRVSPAVHIYEYKRDEYIKMDFIAIANYMKMHQLACMEKEVYLGSREKLKVRLIIHELPKEVVAKRLRKARKYNKDKKRGGLTKEFIARAHLNLFITNANEVQLPIEVVWPLYRLRWQIELIFKIWKSICRIHKVKKVNRHRLECYIYAKLMLIVLGWHILWATAKQLFAQEGKALSFFKAAKTLLRRKINDIREVFFGKVESKTLLSKFYELSRVNHVLEKRGQASTSLELLLESIEASCLLCR